MFTTVAFSGSVNEAGAWTNIPAAPDPHIHTEGNYIYIGEYNKLIGAKALVGTAPLQVQLDSPSIRRINPYYINQLEPVIVQAGNVQKTFHPTAIVPLGVNEGLECLANGTPGGAEQHTVIVFLAPTPLNRVDGNVYTVHFECTPTLAAGVWAYSEIVLVDDVPVGTYDVVGARVESDTSIAFRFNPVGGPYRPGGMCVPSNAYKEPNLQRFGGLGVWFTFNSVQLPGIELLDSAATGAEKQSGYFDLIPKG